MIQKQRTGLLQCRRRFVAQRLYSFSGGMILTFVSMHVLNLSRASYLLTGSILQETGRPDS